MESSWITQQTLLQNCGCEICEEEICMDCLITKVEDAIAFQCEKCENVIWMAHSGCDREQVVDEDMDSIYDEDEDYDFEITQCKKCSIPLCISFFCAENCPGSDCSGDHPFFCEDHMKTICLRNWFLGGECGRHQ